MSLAGLLRYFVLPVILVVIIHAGARSNPPGTDKSGPLSPREELATFQIVKGFRVELAAAEPEIVDPVSLCFDERGRMFVCEMIGYPNGGVGTGDESRGRIRMLTDTDGDGYYETSVVYAEGLRFPMGVVPWKNGIIVAVAPDIRYLEDTTGDGKADKTTILYTGFNLANIQQLVNSLQWGYDGWVYGVAGNNGGTIQSVEKPDAPAVVLQARGFRFRPDVPASLEPTSGGGQYGLTSDEFGHWFTNTNSQHLRQIVFPDHYLRRNPVATVPAVTIDIPDHGAACKVFRISPFEAWRVERTTRRAGGADAKRFAATELVPGGFVTSACSPLVYTANLFSEEFRGNVFVCDPANNLIHRDILEPNGSVFVAKRGDIDCEFLASTDNWFRPVHLSIGPDGSMYVLDFYREVIETPLSLPDDIKEKLNLESRGRGRIWRVVPEGMKRPELPTFSTEKLAEQLRHPNSWVRQTAQRLILQHRPESIADEIAKHIMNVAGTPLLPVTLTTLNELDALTDDLIENALVDSQPGNREVALRLAEPRLASSVRLQQAVVKLTDDPSMMVRFQVALTAGDMPDQLRTQVLSRLLSQPVDTWMQSAVIASAGQSIVPLIEELAKTAAQSDTDVATYYPVLTRAAAMVGGSGHDAEIVELLRLVNRNGENYADLALLEGLGQGMRGKSRSLLVWLTKPPAEATAITTNAVKRLVDASQLVQEEGAKPEARLAAARVLAYAAPEVAIPALAAVLGPQSPPDLQIAAVRSVGAHAVPDVTKRLLAVWPSVAPSVRREILEQLLARPERVQKLLDAIENNVVRTSEIDPIRVAQLRKSTNLEIRSRADKLFAGEMNADRQAIIEKYNVVRELKGDARRGHAVFKAQCAACHKLGSDGYEVGPDLRAVTSGKSTDDLLAAILDPNREVDERYMNYQLNTLDGRTLTGIITGDAPNTITLRRADGSEDTVLRADIESLRSTGLSLMPEGLEKTIAPREMADLLAFLREQIGNQK
jgi:putative membrane-bound dehydrogenase-like protein